VAERSAARQQLEAVSVLEGRRTFGTLPVAPWLSLALQCVPIERVRVRKGDSTSTKVSMTHTIISSGSNPVLRRSVMSRRVAGASVKGMALPLEWLAVASGKQRVTRVPYNMRVAVRVRIAVAIVTVANTSTVATKSSSQL
jgi:hypothetical protein